MLVGGIFFSLQKNYVTPMFARIFINGFIEQTRYSFDESTFILAERNYVTYIRSPLSFF